MKIVYLIKGLGLGGAERHLVDLATSFRQRGHCVEVAYLLPHKNHFIAELEHCGIKVTLVRNGLLGVTSLLQGAKPDLVHAHLPVPAIYARLLKPLFGYRLVVTYHNVLQRQKAPVRIAERAMHGLEDAGISCSQEVAGSMPWSTHVIANGIRPVAAGEAEAPVLRARLGIADASLIVVSVANLTAKKNHALMLRAFDRAIADCEVDAHLVLIGQDGTERSALERLRDQCAHGGRIHFWGPDPDAPLLLREADVFCLSSDHEGLPLALLEAMSQGLPSVVTDAGGMPGAVGDGTEGFVLRRGDEKGFAVAIAALLADRGLRQEMGEAARLRITREFGAERMVERIEDVYDEVLGLGRRS